MRASSRRPKLIIQRPVVISSREMSNRLTDTNPLPAAADRATLVGRVWLPSVEGPALVGVHAGALHDLSSVAPTCSQLLELDDPVAAVRGAPALPRIGSVQDAVATATLLAPCDLQAIKASGVTFVASLLERVIEEQARGDARKADAVRQSIRAIIGEIGRAHV